MSEPSERRVRARVPVERRVEASWGTRKHTVALDDVSLSGARVRIPNPPPVGTSLTIGDGSEKISATVARVEGDIVGLRFDSDEESIGYVIKMVTAPTADGG